jgi:hypothetical protein
VRLEVNDIRSDAVFHNLFGLKFIFALNNEQQLPCRAMHFTDFILRLVGQLKFRSPNEKYNIFYLSLHEHKLPVCIADSNS